MDPSLSRMLLFTSSQQAICIFRRPKHPLQSGRVFPNSTNFYGCFFQLRTCSLSKRTSRALCQRIPSWLPTPDASSATCRMKPPHSIHSIENLFDLVLFASSCNVIGHFGGGVSLLVPVPSRHSTAMLSRDYSPSKSVQ